MRSAGVSMRARCAHASGESARGAPATISMVSSSPRAMRIRTASLCARNWASARTRSPATWDRRASPQGLRARQARPPRVPMRRAHRASARSERLLRRAVRARRPARADRRAERAGRARQSVLRRESRSRSSVRRPQRSAPHATRRTFDRVQAFEQGTAPSSVSSSTTALRNHGCRRLPTAPCDEATSAARPHRARRPHPLQIEVGKTIAEIRTDRDEARCALIAPRARDSRLRA